MRGFGSGINPGHGYNDEEIKVNEQQKNQMFEAERKHFESLSENEKTYYKAFRLSLVKSMEETWSDKTNWWNRVQTMTEDEIENLPNEYVKKFGSFIIRHQEMQQEAHVEVSRDLEHMYSKIKHLEHLKTQEEKDAEAFLHKRSVEADTSYLYELEGYMTRQPRLDLKKSVGNYNYEQFREYTALYDSAKKKDTEELKQFYKMVKYARLNADKGDKSALSFAKKYRLDLIEIPPEFQEESLDDIAIKKDKRTRRTIIRMRTNRDISKYDAWRCYDRQILKGGGKQKCVRKIQLVPALLVKAFGLPAPTETGFEGSGEYNFEDNNLDVFNIADYKQTDFYWGLNRPEGDAYYHSEKNLKKPIHRRSKPWPTI